MGKAEEKQQLQRALNDTERRMEMFLEQAEIERRRANIIRRKIEEVDHGVQNNG